MDKETFVAKALKAHHKLGNGDPGYQFMVWTEEDEKLGAVVSDVAAAIAASSAPRVRPFRLFIEEWETDLISHKNNGIYPSRIYDKYVGMFFYNTDYHVNYQIINLEFKRKRWRVTSAPLEEINDETGRYTVQDGDNDLENYEINCALHQMIRASKYNKGFTFVDASNQA